MEVSSNYSEHDSYFQRTHFKKIIYATVKNYQYIVHLELFFHLVLLKFSSFILLFLFFTAPVLFSPCIDFKDFFFKPYRH